MENTAVSSNTPQQHAVLAFDGDCGFCQAAIQQIQHRAQPQIEAAPWQFLPPYLTQPHLRRLEREVLLLDGSRVQYGGAAALACFLGSSSARRYRAAARLLRLPPLSLAAHTVYRWVARNRHRMPAGTAACAIPRTPH
ncbi:thiol-disulfide oxidoreductase DCC family protein [Streptomyces xanthochromogenes]|uniref:thiol-disulfide oxidoreductase DCC family protein n=1 Tax=Streptomyces xanthochromogenes TaxID=67384 RepID=UPI002F3F6A0C